MPSVYPYQWKKKKKDSGLQEREIEDQTRAWMDLTCLFIFVVLFVCFYK